ncbi:glycoside hydrolase family 31 protein [Plebeiibacterium marinum]|uniref:DUF4968 domain-containing protein n=1 Tax=Plebeiibacterium marinum TaxID=2992111 RepID=A0AAE3SLA9_9BACT|nr:TIM-barrel domain-containing protein [Plebeiobacterium marinum]MCW3807502.1 DUF4968 domain-containing protein [Plebeiobacterium marinum]
MHNYKILNAVFIFLFCVLGQLKTQNLTPGRCNKYEIKGNKVLFLCENGIDVQLEQISSDIFKIRYITDSINMYHSFAVIDQSQNTNAINISEQPNSYEIYTGSLIMRIQKDPFSIVIFDKWQKLLMSDYQTRGFVKDSMRISSSKVLKLNERVYGLGEKNGGINRRGQSFKMWNSDKPCYQADEDPLYKSIPFFMSSEGYGIFFDNTFKTNFDFGSNNQDYYSFDAPGGEMVYYFIYGPTLKQILTNYTSLTGKAIMPPSWALGFAQCRGLLTSENLTREIAEGFRSRDIPCDIIYQDIGWTQHLQDFNWRAGNYENPRKMLSDLDEMGFKVVVSQDPVISQANKEQWKEADSLGYFVLDKRTGKSYDMPWPWGGNCGVVDFTKPEVADWWGVYQQKVIEDGVKGFWTDMGEPAWSNEESTDRLNMQHHLGNHAEIHNVYGFTWDKVVTEQFEKHNPNQRIFQMTRAGFAGLQRYTFGWSGDAGNGNNVCNGWNQLAGQVPLMLSSGLGLIPFWSCDISGYCGDVRDYDELSELYVRWVQFGAFNPLSRIHHEGNNAVEPWLFGEEAEKICKRAIEMKYQLFPYIYSYAREAYDKGWPLVRPLVLEYPDDKEVYNLDSQFLFGENILVAPVVEEGAAIKRVYFPKGRWIDFNNKGNVYGGGKWVEYPVDLETIPMFVKEGSILPQMPVMQYINEKENYPLIVDVFPAGINKKARFEIYEDDGESNNYKQNLYGKRKIVSKTVRTGIELSYSEEVSDEFKLKKRAVFYKFHNAEKPSSVLLDGEKVKAGKLPQDIFESLKKGFYFWDKENKTLTIGIPSEKYKYKLVVK